MTDREKLISLIKNIQDYGVRNEYGVSYVCQLTLSPEEIADHLIAHGVTVRETTSEDFLAKVKDLERKHYRDIETMHSELDFAMEKLLVELGYEDAVDFIRDQERWYS